MNDHVLDCVGVPEFYSDRLGALEDAGSGMLRVVRCIERHGVLVPVFSFVMPALMVLQDGPKYTVAAREIIAGAMAYH